MKLTPAQTWTLKCAAENNVRRGRVNHTQGTIDALVSRGLLVAWGHTTIETFGRPRYSTTQYAITDAGRAALASTAETHAC